MHLTKTGERSSCGTSVAKCVTCCITNMKYHYVPMRLENDELDEIVVSPTMGTDHFPYRVKEIVERIARIATE